MMSRRSESRSGLEPRRHAEAGPSFVTAQEELIISQSHSSVFKGAAVWGDVFKKKSDQNNDLIHESVTVMSFLTCMLGKTNRESVRLLSSKTNILGCGHKRLL